MAIGADIPLKGITVPNSSGAVVASVRSRWVTANDNLEVAQTAGEEYAPGTIDDVEFHWIDIGDEPVTRVLVRAALIDSDSTFTVTTPPIVRIIGEYDDGKHIRLDSPTDNDATGITLLLTTNPTGQMMEDGTTHYSDLTSANGYDLLGCQKVGIVVTTASNTNASGSTVGQLLFIN